MNLTDIDNRILELPEILISEGMIDYTKDFYEALGMSKQNYYAIWRGAKGSQHFTVEHISIVCERFGVNANWVFGLSKKRFLLDLKQASNKNGHIYSQK